MADDLRTPKTKRRKETAAEVQSKNTEVVGVVEEEERGCLI